MTPTNKAQILLSTDSLSSYGLDLVCEIAKAAWYQWLDLALRKNFDARSTAYVKKTSTKHELPICSVQLSNNPTTKEMNQALDICEATGADTITLNAPKFFNLKAYNFMVQNLTKYRQEYPHIKFSIINPDTTTFFALPIPKFRFTNTVDIIKKYSSYVGLDISNIDPDAFENDLMRKLPQLLPYISNIYFSDKSKLGVGHLLPGDGVLKLSAFLRKLKQTKYDRYISTRVSIEKHDLADTDKITIMLTKCREFIATYFEKN